MASKTTGERAPGDPPPPVGPALRRLPIFPLPDAVLFPHALLPLHVFEPRYRKMTRDVLAGRRMMAVAHLRAPELPGEARPAVDEVAGVGEVVMAEPLPDGRFNIVLRGRARVRIVEELTSDEPYRLVRAVTVPDRTPRNRRDLADAEASLRALLDGLADALPQGGELLKQVGAAQETPEELVNVLAAALVTDVEVRQRLLETTNLMARIESVAAELAAVTARVGSSRRAN